MITSSLLKNLEYQDDKPAISVLMETNNTKEIRIAMREGHTMKKHQTPFPIIVEIFEGAIDFGVDGNIHRLSKGDIVALEASVPHDLNAVEDSVVRLSLSKSDSVQRVKKVVE